MTVRSEWNLAKLIQPSAGNPFDRVVTSSGLTVDLTGTEDELRAAFLRTLHIEEDLFNRDITCELKDNEQDCLECSMYVADRQEEPRAPLCRLGRDQRMIEIKTQERRRERFEPQVTIIEGYLELAAVAEV